MMMIVVLMKKLRLNRLFVFYSVAVHLFSSDFYQELILFLYLYFDLLFNMPGDFAIIF